MHLKRYLQIVRFKTYADLQAERSRTYLGFFWWIVEPLLFMGVFYLVFGIGLRRGGDGFVPFLLVGLVLWQWFRATISHSTNAILQNRNLIRQVKLPVAVFPWVAICSDLVKFSVVFTLLVLTLWLGGYLPSAAYAALPLVLLVEFLLLSGVSLMVAALVPLVPDLKFIIDPVLQAMFFMTGIFFDVAALTPEIRDLLMLNPMAGLIIAARGILLHGLWPDAGYLATVAAVGVVLAVAGMVLIRRLEPRYPKLPI